MKREFAFYLIAKEFNIPVEEVRSWKIRKLTKYNLFIEEYYKRIYGDPEDLDTNFTQPKIPAKYRAKGTGKGHGAAGHTYKFK